MERSRLRTVCRAAWAVSLASIFGSLEAATAAEAPVAQQAAGPNSSLLGRSGGGLLGRSGGGLLGRSGGRLPLTKANFNWLVEMPTEKEEIRKWDIVTVIVKHSAVVTSEGEMDRKKKTEGDMVLTDWVLLNGLHLFPDPQGRGDPRVAAKLQNKERNEAELTARDKMEFSLACHVVDIRPNGNLVLEGHYSIRNNDENWNLALTGEVRPADVQPNNTILSEDVADLKIDKQERGHVRDGYRRGWLVRWLDKIQP